MINSINTYLNEIRAAKDAWGENAQLWFRGEPESKTPLLPKLYREKDDGSYHDENALLQMFRMKAPSFITENAPRRDHETDKWLFLAQHVGLPTRLLDWTENALLALSFALKKPKPILWILNPHGLNLFSIPKPQRTKMMGRPVFPLTWIHPDPFINIGNENIRGAWEVDGPGLPFPVAVHPTYIHPRMSSQISVFTVHGKRKEPICNLVPNDILIRCRVSPRSVKKLRADLKVLGIRESLAFPDLEGLTRELSEFY